MLRDAVWRALETVLDPELDEPITDLDFVESCTVSADGVAAVRLRLPTFFCAPNFSFLMVADAFDAVSAVPGVTRAEVVPADHDAPLLVHPDGTPVTVEQVPLHLRRARLTRVGIESNGMICRSLLAN